MGKKVSQSSVLKIPKNDHKKQLNSLIKVLRPKVYITDSSSFKRLVQELTGNGGPISISISISSPPSPSTIPPQVDKVRPVIQIDDLCYQESSVELSVDSSELSVPTPFSTAPEGSPEPWIAAPSTACESLFMTHDMDLNLSQYRDIESSPQPYMPAPFTACETSFMTREMDIESWLLEMEPLPYYDSYAPPFVQQEVCVYDYDLSGLI